MGDPHVVLHLGHVLFGRCLLGERPRQHELGLEYGFHAVHDPIQGGPHPGNGRMPDVALHVAHLPASIALVPGAVELLGRPPEPHNEVTREVLRLGLASFLAPQADQSGLIITHDDSGVRATDKGSAESHDTLQFSGTRISAGALRITRSTSAENFWNRSSSRSRVLPGTFCTLSTRIAVR